MYVQNMLTVSIHMINDRHNCNCYALTCNSSEDYKLIVTTMAVSSSIPSLALPVIAVRCMHVDITIKANLLIM